MVFHVTMVALWMTSPITIWWWDIITDDWELDEICLVSDGNCNYVNLQSPKKLQGMTINVGLTFGVGDTRPQLTISIEKDN